MKQGGTGEEETFVFRKQDPLYRHFGKQSPSIIISANNVLATVIMVHAGTHKIFTKEKALPPDQAAGFSPFQQLVK